MSNSVDVAIGIIDGKVVAKWHQPTTEIVFDPQNAYNLGLNLSKAAMDAYRGTSGDPSKDLAFLSGELKITVNDVQRAFLIDKVATVIRTFRNQEKSDGYIAMHAVDMVLAATAR